MSTSNHETKTAFWAMVSRDLLVQWRDHNEFIFRVAMLPLILIVVYGFMLPTVGLLPAEFPTHMFCGMIGMSMLITGIHGTAVPISMDFHNLREIEDRLLAPVSSRTVAYAKMTVGVLESFVGGLIVLPISLIFMGHAISIDLSPERLPLLVLVLPVMQAITLIDPLTWINEAIRAVMTPQIYSLPLWGTLLGMVIWILFMGRVAFKRFDRMVYRH